MDARRKLCNKCGRNLWRTSERFYRDATASDGLSSHCKRCILQKVKAAGPRWCKDCGVRHARQGGLCRTCYNVSFGKDISDEALDAMTDQELDDMIAERRLNPPPWWPKNGAKDVEE